MELRRQFDLLSEDQKFLDEYGLPWETLVDGSRWVLLHDFGTPAGYSHSHVTAAVRLETTAGVRPPPARRGPVAPRRQPLALFFLGSGSAFR